MENQAEWSEWRVVESAHPKHTHTHHKHKVHREIARDWCNSFIVMFFDVQQAAVAVSYQSEWESEGPELRLWMGGCWVTDDDWYLCSGFKTPSTPLGHVLESVECAMKIDCRLRVNCLTLLDSVIVGVLSCSTTELPQNLPLSQTDKLLTCQSTVWPLRLEGSKYPQN